MKFVSVKELHREFALSGSDLLQAFVFYGNDDKLNVGRKENKRLSAKEVNNAGCRLVTEIAEEYDCLIGFPFVQTIAYAKKLGKEKVQEEFMSQLNIFKDYKVDLLIPEFMSTVEEAEWAIEVMKTLNLPISSTLCIGPLGDFNDVPLDECAVRLAKAGADIIGVNCRFDPMTAVESIKIMKKAVEEEGLSVHFMTQPCGYRTFGVGKGGQSECPELPFAMESRLISRWDAQKYARAAFEAGVRYIGGCCGFQSYHIRAVAEELFEETGKLPRNSRSRNACSLKHHAIAELRERANKEYWYNLIPQDGRDPAEKILSK